MTDFHPASAASYSSVPIGGGGYATGIVCHPGEDNLVYMRSDVAGAFRWDETNKSWIPLCDKMGFWNRHHYSIESIAVDPNNTNVVYIAAGEWLDDGKEDAIFKSTNRGSTWTKLGLNVDMAGNANWRWGGERLMVDPGNSSVLYFASRKQGLHRSLNGGTTWSKLSLPSDGNSGVGVAWVIPVAGENIDGRSKIVYAGVYHSDGYRIFSSFDGGATWTDTWINAGSKPGSGLQPVRATVDAWGALIVSMSNADGTSGGVWKRYWDNAASSWKWKDITPAGNYAAYSGISAKNGSGAEYITGQYSTNGGRKFFITYNGGDSWTEINRQETYQMAWMQYGDENWYDMFGPASSSLVYDPRNSSKVWMTDWFSAWRTTNIYASKPLFTSYVKNYEVLVGFTLLAPKEGTAKLFSGIADVGGFRHTSLTTSPLRQADMVINPQDITSFAMADNDANTVYAVGGWRWKSGSYGVKSTDNGVTWSQMAAPFSGAKNGRIRTNRLDSSKLIWIAENNRPYRSSNGGASWTEVTSLPTNIMTGLWKWYEPLDADYVWNGTFYIYNHSSKKFYITYDNGSTWQQPYAFANSDAMHVLKAAPGRGGECWIGFEWNGLWKGGWSFSKVPGVEWCFNFTFGKGTSDSQPSIFVYGRVNGQEGLFVSYDLGNTWKKIYNFGDGPFDRDVRYMEGDRLQSGVVYIATGGRGIVKVTE